MIEHVITEWDYYDGPKSGIALFNWIPHRFSAEFDESQDDYSEIFLLWPINDADLLLEIEQWRIFVEWNDRYEEGNSTIQFHPGHGGINARWDEIQALMATSREPPELELIRANAVFHRLSGTQTRGQTMQLSGP